MAKRKRVISGTREVMKQLTNISKEINDAASQGVLDAARNAQTAAKEKLKKALDAKSKTESPHQKMGRKMLNEIGVDYKNGVATVYAPITQSKLMREQMYYTEYGAGWESDSATRTKPWYYYSTANDANPNKLLLKDRKKLRSKTKEHRANKTKNHGSNVYKKATSGKGRYRYIAWTKGSPPIHYMRAASNYLNRKAQNDVRDSINVVLTRKVRKPKGHIPFMGVSNSEE